MPTAHFPLLRDPQGSCQHRGRCPHPRSPRGRGAGKNLLHPYHRSVGSPPTCKGQAATRFASQALTGFPAPSASVSFATPTEMERGQGRRSRAFLPLTPWNRPNTHRRGRWIGFATCPCGLKVSGVWGKAPQALFFVFEVVRVDVTVQKRSKKCAFLESLLLKTPQIWPISDPTPTLTGVSNQKTSVFASEYTKNNSQKLY